MARVMVALLKSRINSGSLKVIIYYSPINPDDEQGEKRVVCFYTDLFRVLKEDIPSRKVGSRTRTLGGSNARISKEQLTAFRPLAGSRKQT